MLQLQPELPALKEQGVDFYIVSMDSEKELKAFFGEKKVAASIVRDSMGSVFMAYGVDGIPTSCYFDKQGKLVDQTVGWGTGSLAKFKEKVLGLAAK